MRIFFYTNSCNETEFNTTALVPVKSFEDTKKVDFLLKVMKTFMKTFVSAMKSRGYETVKFDFHPCYISRHSSLLRTSLVVELAISDFRNGIQKAISSEYADFLAPTSSEELQLYKARETALREEQRTQEKLAKNFRFAVEQQEEDERWMTPRTERRMTFEIMQNTLPCPYFDISHEDRLVEDRTIGIAECCGRRETMEDFHVAESLVLRAGNEDVPAEIYAVLDGHGGDQAACFVAENLKNVLSQCFASHNKHEMTLSGAKKTLKDTCLILNREFFRLTPISYHQAGTTATIVLVLPNYVFFANVGDSRAIIFDTKEEKTTQMTEDASPGIPRYRRKIEQYSGKIFEYCSSFFILNEEGGGRILAVAREIGGSLFPTALPDPKITVCSRDSFESGVTVISCDGLYESLRPKFCITSSAAGSAAAQLLALSNTPGEVAKNLVYSAIEGSPQSSDNVSAIIIPGKNRAPINTIRPITPPPIVPLLDLSTVRCISEEHKFRISFPETNTPLAIATIQELLNAISDGTISPLLFNDFRSRNDFLKWFEGSFDIKVLSSKKVSSLRKALSERDQNKMIQLLKNI